MSRGLIPHSEQRRFRGGLEEDHIDLGLKGDLLTGNLLKEASFTKSKYYSCKPVGTGQKWLLIKFGY
jgi:hypothetical protein